MEEIMKVNGITIPQAAIDAGNAALTGDFRLEDIRGAVAEVLYELYHTGDDHSAFDYGANSKDAIHDRVADRIIQAAKKTGRVWHLGGGRWKAM
jgi:hypothetical protein